MGADGSVETNWFVLLHRRVTGAGRPQPALPVVGPGRAAGRAALAQHHLHRLRGRPAHGQGGLPHQLLRARLGLDRAAARLRRRRAVLRQGRRPLRPPSALPVRPARGHGQRRSSPRPRPTSGCSCSPAPSTGCRAPRPARRRWRSSSSCSHREDRVKALGWWSLVGRRRPGAGRDAGLAGDPVLRVADAVLGPARAPGHRLGWSWRVLLPSGRRRRRHGRGGGRRRVGRAGRERSQRLGRAWTGSGAGAWPASVTAAMLVLSIGPIVGWTSPAVITCGRRRRRARRPCSSGAS